MTKCPKCNKIIEYLDFVADIRSLGIVEDNKTGMDWCIRDTDGWNNVKVSCPVCKEVLFEDEDEVEPFLKGG